MSTAGVSGTSNFSIPAETTRVAKKTLDQNDFLNLLVSQLKNQDPLQPESNDQFVATMAQFSSLNSLTSLDKSTKYDQAISMVNKTVTVQEPNKDPVTGVVEKVSNDDGNVQVYIDGNGYDLSNVTEVQPDQTSQTAQTVQPTIGTELLQAAMLIGKDVTLSGGIPGGTVEKVGLVNGAVNVYVNGTPYDISLLSEISNPG